MIRRKAVVAGLLLVLLTGVGRTQQPTTGPAANSKLTPQQRADALLKQMTIEEKAMQLSTVFPVGMFGADGPIPSQLDEHLKHGIGHVAALSLIGHKTPEQMAKYVNARGQRTQPSNPPTLERKALGGITRIVG